VIVEDLKHLHARMLVVDQTSTFITFS
jgi:hypothetical protein